MQQRIQCPNPVCPQPDDVQKVSVVVGSGTTEGLQRFSSGTYSVQSSLSRQLSAPTAPENRGAWEGGSIVLMAILIFLSLPVFTAIAYTIQRGFDYVANDGAAVTFFFIGVGCLGGIVLLVAYKRREAAAYRKKYATHFLAIGKWNRLYYCNRCGSVFDPSDAAHRFVPASQMNDLLV